MVQKDDSKQDKSQTTLEAKLGALQCHFTWDLDSNAYKLFHLRDTLEDIGTKEGTSCRAAEAFHQIRNTISDEGPWLVVNYGNLAWLHHHLGEEEKSQAYLSK
eukprot:superscaffoldBa00008692_g23561